MGSGRARGSESGCSCNTYDTHIIYRYKDNLISRDFILRQIQQLVQVMAQVMMLRKGRNYEEAREEIQTGLMQAFGTTLADLHELPDDQLLERCQSVTELNAELALAIADLFEQEAEMLWEEGAVDQARAYWGRTRFLYEAVLDQGDTVPLHAHEKLAYLKNQTTPS